MKDLLVIGLAAWRLAEFLTAERGPFGFMERLRALLHADDPEANEQGKLFGCVYCMSLWTALGSAVIWEIAPPVINLIAVWGVATAIGMMVRKE